MPNLGCIASSIGGDDAYKGTRTPRPYLAEMEVLYCLLASAWKSQTRSGA